MDAGESHELSDEELVRLCQRDPARLRGEAATEVRREGRAALEELLQRNYDWIMRVCVLQLGDVELAEDAAQEVMLRISRSIHRFKGDAALSTWIYTILRRTLSQIFRKRGRNLEVLATDTGQFERVQDAESSKAPNPAEAFELSEDNQHLLRRIRQLPRRQTEAMILHYFEDLSVEECAARMSCSVASVKTHLHRGRQALKKTLAEESA